MVIDVQGSDIGLSTIFRYDGINGMPAAQRSVVFEKVPYHACIDFSVALLDMKLMMKDSLSWQLHLVRTYFVNVSTRCSSPPKGEWR